MKTELGVSARVGLMSYTTGDPIKGALLLRVEQLDRLLESFDDTMRDLGRMKTADRLMKMSRISNESGMRTLGSCLVSLATHQQDIEEFFRTRKWPENIQRYLDIVNVHRDTCWKLACEPALLKTYNAED